VKIFRHEWAFIRLVVRPLVDGAFLFVVATGVVVGLAAYIWFGAGSDEGNGQASESDLLEASGQEVTYSEALARIESGDVDGGREDMRLLAPLDTERMGDPEAHVWLARDLLGLHEEKVVPSREALVDARQHLQRLVESEAGGVDVVALLVQVHLAQKEPARALTLIDEEAKQFPELHLLGAKVAAASKRPGIRDRHAVAASAYFQKMMDDETSSPEERTNATLGLAETEKFLGRFVEMRELAQGLPDDDSRKRKLLLQSWLGSVQKGMLEGRPSGETLAVLNQALLEVGPEVRLINLVAAMAAQDPDSAEIAAMYESITAKESVEAATLVPLGSLAVLLGKREEGLGHLERAVTLAPSHLVALNNLAYSLGERGGEGDLERGLEMASRAVAMAADRGTVPANLWETRGQIFAKLGRWRESVVDLERALKQMSGSLPMHATLGRAYRELGQEDLAEEHLRLGAKN